MNRTTLKLNEITVEGRLREDYGDLSSLKDSISRVGLIQPIVVNQENRLVAGGRRYRAHLELGLDRIDVCYKETLDEAHLHELELEENSKRLDQPWTERCLGIAEIHRLRRVRGALEGWKWGQRETAEMFGMEVGTVNYVLRVAVELRKEKALPPEKRRYHNFNSINEAWRLGIMQDELDRAQAELARRAKLAANNGATPQEAAKVVAEIKQLEASPDLFLKERQRYESNPLNTVPFDEYWQQRVKEKDEIENTVYLHNRVIHLDCVDWMLANPSSVDHIITDPPYAIDMDMLQQENVGMDVSRVANAHDVDENLTLLAKFIPAAFTCIRERGFLVMCCDVMVWHYMYTLATDAGFAVQRWPFIWLKSNACSNNANQYNTTKNFELVMLCRKPTSVLAKPCNTSSLLASNDEAKRITGHPFAKPFELTRTLCETVSIEGQTILEPFAGGGSMAIEMLRMKRNVIAIEKEPHHYPALLENIKREYYLKLNPKFVFK